MITDRRISASASLAPHGFAGWRGVRCRAILAGVVWLAGVLGLAASSSASSTSEQLWIEVTDERGRIVRDLDASDLAVMEGDQAVSVLGLQRSAATATPTPIVLYFDHELSTNGNLRRAAEAFASLAQPLVELGPVTLVLADPEPEAAMTARDALVLGERLARLGLTGEGRSRLLDLRRRTLARLQAPSLAPAERATVVAAAIEEELALVRERQARLLAWAAEQPGAAPRALFFVADGFDLDPVTFYAQHLDEATLRSVVQATLPGSGETASGSEPGSETAPAAASSGAPSLPPSGAPSSFQPLEPRIEATARALAATGWTLLPVAVEGRGGSRSASGFTVLESEDQQGNTTAVPGITLRPGALFRRGRGEAEEAAEEQIPEPSLVSPLVPLELLAAASGGEVVKSEIGLRDAVERLAGRYALVYASTLPADADLQPIEVRVLRPGLSARTRRWTSRGTPDLVTTLRLERLLRGEELPGLEVTSVLRVAEGPAGEEAAATAELEARLDLRDVAGVEDAAGELGDAEETGNDTPAAAAPADAPAGAVRVSVAVAAPGGEVQVLRRELVRGQDLRQLETWTYRAALDLPPRAREVAVVIEDVARGLWGGGVAAVVAASGAEAADLLPSPTVVEIKPPDAELLRGSIRFEAAVYDRAVSRVVFLLDETEVGEAIAAPYTARIDLGRTPRKQLLSVVAYDAEGNVLGRDSAVLNGGSGGLGVEIVAPTNLRGTGAVEVEARVEVPLERRLDRVLFFWNSDPVATLFTPPFRQRIYVPPDKPVGYVRVVALLDDGTVAEDVAFLNGPEASERLEVNLVELYTVVVDKDGRPVRGLTREDFEVLEDGVRQEIATFSDASDLPLTLGMAIDSSASMFVKLPKVQRAAIRFLESTFAADDRAFVVDFDSQPRLARSTTQNLDSVVRAIESLEPSGRTALWESVVFSLVQLQGVRGRKALVVFSDGADEDDEFPFNSCLQFARRMGVPIYLILMRREPEPSVGLNLLSRSFASRVDRLVSATGGRVFYAEEYRDLGEVYDEIEIELRSQYLLAYYPSGPTRHDAWRNVDVAVEKKGLTPRTLSGYWP